MPRGNPKKPITVRIDRTLLAQVDKARAGLDRTAYIEKALRAQLEPKRRKS